MTAELGLRSEMEQISLVSPRGWLVSDNLLFFLNWLNNHKWNKCPESIGLFIYLGLFFFIIIYLEKYGADLD